MAEDDYPTGRPAKDDQMKAIRKAQGEPKRQSAYPPKLGEKSLEGEYRDEED